MAQEAGVNEGVSAAMMSEFKTIASRALPLYASTLRSMGAELEITRSITLPLREVSGLALRTVDGRSQLCAIGDGNSAIVTGNVMRDGGMAPFTRSDVGALVGRKSGSQWEAIASDGAGNLFVLQETPGNVLVLNSALDGLLHSIELCVGAKDTHVPEGWLDHENSRGEGLVLLGNGHLLVVKEKDPPLLVEFGPRGSKTRGIAPKSLQPHAFPLPGGGSSEYVPLQSWTIDSKDELDDLSDVAVFGGELYLISDKERCLVQVESSLPGEGGGARVIARWRLPKKVKKPEGFVLYEGRVPLIAIDHDKDEPNLFVLEALTVRA